MDLEAAYLEAALPLPVTLLGQPLKPYSLGHEMILQRLRSPFLSTEEPEFHDLKLAVLICCHEFDEALAALEASDLKNQLDSWQEQIGELPELERRVLVSDFELYRNEGMRCPKFRPFRRGRLGRRPGAPFLAILFYTLMAELGFSRREALNAPYGFAHWMFCTHKERKQEMAITSAADEEEEAAIEKALKERGMVRMKINQGASALPQGGPPEGGTPNEGGAE